MTHCPRCQQPLPEPTPRFCPNCGLDVAAGEPMAPDTPGEGASYAPPPLPPLPPGGAPPPLPGAPPPAGGGPPWERRHQIGFAAALIETTQQVLTSPAAFFRSMPVTGGIGGPLLYGVIVAYIGQVASALYSFILQSTLGSAWQFGRGSELEKYLPMLSSGMGLIGQLVFAPLLLTIVLFIATAITHVCLLLLGGATHGFEATFRVNAYTEATSVIRIVPVCGDLVYLIYCLVVAIIGLSEAHRISGLKAALAVLLPLILLCCCCGVGLMVAAGGLASLIGNVQ
jgi:hypothetical protein